MSPRTAPIQASLFRTVLSAYPTGVVIVCADADAGPRGMACNSFTSVSIDPPLVCFCPAKTSTTWPKIREVGRFCISVLGAHHEEICRRFARPEADRFQGTAVQPRLHGPGLADAAAWIDCILEAEHDAGDHSIAVARVCELDAGTSVDPLVFWRGGYGSFVAP
jgi:3-hydroxy-9,10-secoandrosta-1,3,5(10)-triene-9,17-dione monooxygenase reductase component